MKKILIIISIIILIIVSNKEYDKVLIPDNSIRIRVIANSNKLEDQQQKLLVKKTIEKKLYKDLEDIKDIDKARNIIKQDVTDINKLVYNTIDSNNFNVNYGINYFPKKEYKGIKYEEGYYESLVINLGEGKGNNWWCVLFPPLCLIDTNKEEFKDLEYKSKIIEILNNYK